MNSALPLLRDAILSLLVVLAIVFGSDCSAQESNVLLASKDSNTRVNRTGEIEQYLKADYVHAFDEVEVDPKHILVRGKLSSELISGHAIDSIRLLELRPQTSSIDWQTAELSYPIEIDEGGLFVVRLDRFNQGYDRLYSRWALVAKRSQEDGTFRRISKLSYATDLSKLIDANSPKKLTVTADPLSKKGLGGIHLDPALFSDLAELGLRHLAINISIAGLIDPSGNTELVTEFDGERIALRPAAVAQLDRLFAFAAEHQMTVSAIILMPRLPSTHPYHDRLVHPNCVDGHYSMANVTSREGVACFIAMMEFLAQRYSGGGGSKGRIENWIVHNEVDAGWVWTNAGEKTSQEYLELYARVMRLVDLSTRKFNPHAQTFISLTHSWTQAHQPNQLRYYPARDLLELLQQWSNAEGDFPWGIAYHPYPQDLFNPRIWDGPVARDDRDSPIVTFRNLQVLNDWVNEEQHLMNPPRLATEADLSGDEMTTGINQRVPRPILLSEQGFHSGDQSEAAQQLQAAALVFAWQQIQSCENIEAFHYHRWIDHEREGGLNLGLWTVKEGTLTYPDEKKFSWEVMKALGTDEDEAVTEFAKDLIEIK